MFTDRRGATETLGFVLVFSLIVTTVGVVYTVGYTGLQDVRDAEQVTNAERAFDVFAANVDDILRRGAPSRGTEIRLAEASIGTGDPTYLNVTGVDGGSQVFASGNYTIEPVVYRADDVEIRYAAGAVTRIQDGGAVMLDSPPFLLDGDRVLVPIVQFSTADRTVSGSQTVRVRTERRIRQVVVDERSTVDTVRVNVTTPAPDPWTRYLEAEGMDCTRVWTAEEYGKLSCTLSDVERTKVVWFEIKVTFE